MMGRLESLFFIPSPIGWEKVAQPDDGCDLTG
jgi:hypothetical protein